MPNFADENTNPSTSLLSLPSSSASLTTNDATKTSTLSLKRKRPLMIEIPSVLREIQIDKIKPKDDNTIEDKPFGFKEMGVGVFAKKGKKRFMEDTHKIVSSLNGNPNKVILQVLDGFYGIYDGHGGRKAAEFVAEKLHENVLKMLEKCEGNTGKEAAVKTGYLKTDEEFLKQGISSGTCCITCIVEEKDIIVSNIGDCRAVLCRSGVAEALTKDHRAEQVDEQRRIEKKGGYVEFHRGAWRVHGILSVSRSIGDVHLKDWVLAEPETKILELNPGMDFIILASDGLWEKVGNQEAVDLAMRVCLGSDKLESTNDPWKDDFGCENTSPPSKSRRISLVKHQKLKAQSPLQEIKQSNKKPNCVRLTAACKQLVNLAVTRGSLDDITVMIVDLRHFLYKIVLPILVIDKNMIWFLYCAYLLCTRIM